MIDLSRLDERELDRRPAELKRQMQHRALNETYYFGKVILGYDKLTPHTHGPLCEYLDTDTYYRRLVQMPRSHFKTTLVTITKRLQDYLNDPNIRMLIVGNTGTNVKKHLRKIKAQLMGNKQLRWLFPERVWEDVRQAQEWSADSIYLPCDANHGEPTFDTIGAAGEATSRHYDLINADDLIGEDEAYSETEMARVIEWSTGLESLLIPPVDGRRIDVVSNYWRTDDVYAFFEKEFGGGLPKVAAGPHSYTCGPLSVFRRGAREAGQPIFPEAVSNAFLDRLQEYNPERYAAQYANNPYESSVAYFKPQYLRFYNWRPDAANRILYIKHNEEHIEIVHVDNLYRIGLVDPHAGGRQNRFRFGGRAAVLMAGVQPSTGRIFMLDCWIKRAPTNIIIDEIFRQNEEWVPEMFSIEANGLQKMLKYWIDERAEREGLPDIPYEPYIPKGSKLDDDRRIKGLQPLFRAGQIWIQAGFDEFQEEYRAWPRGSQDGMDAFAQILEYAQVGWDSITDQEMEEHEQEIRMQCSVATGY